MSKHEPVQAAKRASIVSSLRAALDGAEQIEDSFLAYLISMALLEAADRAPHHRGRPFDVC